MQLQQQNRDSELWLCCVCRIAPCGLPKPSTWLCERFHGRTGKPGRVNLNGGGQQCQSAVAWPYAIVQVPHLQVPPGKACSTCCALWQWVQASGATSHQCVGLAFCSQPTVGLRPCVGVAHTHSIAVCPLTKLRSQARTLLNAFKFHMQRTQHITPPPGSMLFCTLCPHSSRMQVKPGLPQMTLKTGSGPRHFAEVKVTPVPFNTDCTTAPETQVS